MHECLELLTAVSFHQVMGDIVNLSARLMAAAGPDQVYVDEATKLQTEDYMNYNVSCGVLFVF